jgi:hypothetical protein
MDVVATMPTAPTPLSEVATILSQISSTGATNGTYGPRQSARRWRRVGASVRAIAALLDVELGSFTPVVGHERVQATTALRGVMRVADLLATIKPDTAVTNAIGSLLFVCGRDLGELGGDGR